jgi:ParB-like chromosome segregation protein Spo0J
MQIIKIKIDDITPYKNNAKKHTDEQIQHIINSIEKFGFNDPIGIWGDENIIVEGHGRYFAMQKLGNMEVECIRLDHLSDEERRAYTLVHNQATLETPFDFDILNTEIDSIFNFYMSDFGFAKFDINDGNEEYSNFEDIAAKENKTILICPHCGKEIKNDN